MSLTFDPPYDDEEHVPIAVTNHGRELYLCTAKTENSEEKASPVTIHDVIEDLGDEWFFRNTPIDSMERLYDFKKTLINKIKPKTKFYLDIYNYLYSLTSQGNMKRVELDEGEEFLPLPMTSIGAGRECVCFIGMSGSGKSFLCNKYMRSYQKMYPKNPIYVFSYLDKCSSLDEGVRTERLPCTDPDELTENPYEAKSFKDCLVVFDDCKSIQDDTARKIILKLQDQLLEIGRHNHVSVAICTHTAFGHNETKVMKQESHSAIIYSTMCNPTQTKKYLEDNFAMSKKESEIVFGLPSRWVMVRRSFPPLVLTSTSCMLKSAILPK